jgi:hypothetical protein
MWIACTRVCATVCVDCDHLQHSGKERCALRSIHFAWYASKSWAHFRSPVCLFIPVCSSSLVDVYRCPSPHTNLLVTLIAQCKYVLMYAPSLARSFWMRQRKCCVWRGTRSGANSSSILTLKHMPLNLRTLPMSERCHPFSVLTLSHWYDCVRMPLMWYFCMCVCVFVCVCVCV